MSYKKDTCSYCEQPVLSRDGRAIKHVVRSTESVCEGSGELTANGEDTGAQLEEPSLVKPTPLANIVQTKPDENALRLLALRLRLKDGASIKDVVEAVNARSKQGSIDLEALAKCDCPSVRAAIQEYLKR